jgi:hypothetical protein
VQYNFWRISYIHLNTGLIVPHMTNLQLNSACKQQMFRFGILYNLDILVQGNVADTQRSMLRSKFQNVLLFIDVRCGWLTDNSDHVIIPWNSRTSTHLHVKVVCIVFQIQTLDGGQDYTMYWVSQKCISDGHIPTRIRVSGVRIKNNAKSTWSF